MATNHYDRYMYDEVLDGLLISGGRKCSVHDQEVTLDQNLGWVKCKICSLSKSDHKFITTVAAIDVVNCCCSIAIVFSQKIFFSNFAFHFNMVFHNDHQ